MLELITALQEVIARLQFIASELERMRKVEQRRKINESD